MKLKSYADKPWWPRKNTRRPKPRPGSPILDRVAVFRYQVALTLRKLGTPVSIQNRTLAAAQRIAPGNIRPDIGRQAQEWVEQHRKLPRPTRRRHQRKPRAKAPPCPPRQRRQPKPRLDTTCSPIRPGLRGRPLSPVIPHREALVLRYREQEQQHFAAIIARLGTTREAIRRIYARALTRRRRAATLR